MAHKNVDFLYIKQKIKAVAQTDANLFYSFSNINSEIFRPN